MTATPAAAETTSSAKYVVPLKDDKSSILLNVESGVKELIGSLAKKSKIEGCDIDESGNIYYSLDEKDMVSSSKT